MTDTNLALVPKNIDEAMRLAELLSKSDIVPKDYQGKPGNVLIAIQWGLEIGLGTLQALQNIACVNGRPSLWGDAMLALVRGSGLLESFHEEISDTQATCTVKRCGHDPVSRTFTVDDARKAGLFGKAGPWTQYPKRMMQMRARGWALRDEFTDVIKGIACAEEVMDLPPVVKDMGTIVAEPKAAETLKDKVRKAVSKTEPESPLVTLESVAEMINGARTKEELKGLAVLVGTLTEDDKAKARERWPMKMSVIEAQAETVNTETGEIVGAEE